MNTTSIRQRTSKGSMVVPIEFSNKGTSSSSTSHGYHRRRTRRSSRIKICGYSIKKYQIWRRIGILFMVLLFCILLYNNYLSPPGINLFSFGYWRLSHHNSNNAEIQAIQQKSFPRHIIDSAKNENEYEMIDHPGFQMANQTKLKVISNEMNITRQIKVPKFWEDSTTSAYGPDGVREFLGYKGKYLISKEEASAIGSYYATKETIYVAVTSYRDPECLPTVEDLFTRAKYPDRIRVGIVDQILVDRGDKLCTTPATSCNQNPNQVLCKYSHNIDSIEYDARYMIGPTFARHVANRMYRGEYYSMQVDSHVRFVQDWDDVAIQQWKSIGNEMAVLTNYMSDIVNSIDPITHKSLRETRSMMCKIEFEWLGSIQQHIRYTIQPNNKPRIDDNTPMLQPFWAAGFAFARGHFTVQVPYDRYLPMVFQGEEISMSIRAFTFGYDFYAPSQHVAFHMYAVRENKDKRQAVSNFNENEVLFPDAKKAAYIRLNSIIGDDIITTGDNNNNKIEADNYGLGHVRSIDKFYKTFGIDMKLHKVEDSLCDFVQGTRGIESMHQKFSPQLRYDGMGIDYSRISYEHKTIVREETTVDEKELEILRERLRKRKTEK